MHNGLQRWMKEKIRTDLPDVRPGDTIQVHIIVRERDRERVQVFEGTVIARQGAGSSETITVRKMSFGVGVEKIFPLSSPSIEKIEIVHRSKVRRAKLYYLRDKIGKEARLKAKHSTS